MRFYFESKTFSHVSGMPERRKGTSPGIAVDANRSQQCSRSQPSHRCMKLIFDRKMADRKIVDYFGCACVQFTRLTLTESECDKNEHRCLAAERSTCCSHSLPSKFSYKRPSHVCQIPRRRTEKLGAEKYVSKSEHAVPITVHANVRKLGQDGFAQVAYEVMGHVFQVHSEFGRFLREEIYHTKIAKRTGKLAK